MSAPHTPASHRLNGSTARLLRGIGWALVALLLCVCVALFVGRIWLRGAMRASLPQIDGEIRIAGLQHPVRVERDEHGIPHITAQSIDDLVFAQAYITAQDRLWQMDILRRHPAGELAEILGSKFIDHDKLQRTLQLRNAADSAIKTLDPDERHSLERYAEGVNAFLADNADHLPAEFRVLGYKPRPWTARDGLLVGFAMAEDLSTSYPHKLNREAIAAKLDPSLQADLYPVGSPRDHVPAEGKPSPGKPVELEQTSLDQSEAALRSPEHMQDLVTVEANIAQFVSRFRCDGCSAGSNNWVVAGAHTTTGQPLLSNDMHLALGVPGIWYTANLEAPGIHVAGVSLPGVPFIIVGHNQHIAWGFTNSTADVQDVYIENIANDKFQTPDGTWRPVEHRREVIAVKHGANIEWDVALTRHGNLLTPIITPMFPSEKRQLALLWSVYDPANASAPFANVNRAGNWNEFCEAFSSFGVPSQNVVYADDSGNIGYHLVGRVPIRGNSGLTPVPVRTGEYEWTGYIPFAQLPSVFDPPGGILATANARIAPDDYTPPISLDWLAPYRNERIWKVLAAKDKLNPADMLALQNDVYSDFDKQLADRIVYAVDRSAKASKRSKDAAEILRTWDGNVNMLSAAPSIVNAARTALTPMLLEPKLGDSARLYTWGGRSVAIEHIFTSQPARWLPGNYSNWNDFLVAALELGLKQANAPADLSNWQWGKVNQVAIAHPIFGITPWIDALLSTRTGTGTWPIPGNGYTVRPGLPRNGASERFTANLGALDQSTLNIVTGESANPMSPWYLDQFPHWLEGTTLPLPFTQQHATHTLVLQPR